MELTMDDKGKKEVEPSTHDSATAKKTTKKITTKDVSRKPDLKNVKNQTELSTPGSKPLPKSLTIITSLVTS
jgi:hypothetical protein